MCVECRLCQRCFTCSSKGVQSQVSLLLYKRGKLQGDKVSFIKLQSVHVSETQVPIPRSVVARAQTHTGDTYDNAIIRSTRRGWKDDSVVKGTRCSCRGPGFAPYSSYFQLFSFPSAKVHSFQVKFQCRIKQWKSLCSATFTDHCSENHIMVQARHCELKLLVAQYGNSGNSYWAFGPLFQAVF